MEHSNPTLAKISILDTGKFEQWKFRIQQYLQNEHYALWEVIEFGDSYEAPKDVVEISSVSEGSAKKKGMTVAVTTEDMQKKRNDVKARTTLLLALPDEHQLRFSKYKTAQELWAVILKTFGGNEATRKTKKNLLKQQYGNFKAEGKETLEQTFNRLHAIVSHLEFMDVEIEQDDLNQKLLTSLAPEWLMHTIVWRNRSDLDTMSLDDLYNHLKVYEPEVQKKSDSQNLAFISSAKNSSGNGKVNTASIPTTRERLARLTDPSVHPSPILLPSSGCLTQTQALRITSTQALTDEVTATLPPSSVDRRDEILESERPPRKRMTLQETVWTVEKEAYAARVAWNHSIRLSQATYQELQTHRDHVYTHETHIQTHQTQLQLQSPADRDPSCHQGHEAGDERYAERVDISARAV
nr:hypothetical protein [Tanacetum cinerariifolium]